ncbi:fimbria/pilus outer membrane usher protein [Shewanella cutis]|uniref:Fimbrial biogenesis outer membrane usher protein n=1 Tax=Shewanella cutis TaxID=2766780 RepID=A0ABS9R0V7_9GAMM|nr:fimbria/pilus outer membrane usher protein [Shewanella sp. PS-2]MCG9966232.1 fimbrial biogenesis outer membrane usher protein [Shewanella sp. PS-2]
MNSLATIKKLTCFLLSTFFIVLVAVADELKEYDKQEYIFEDSLFYGSGYGKELLERLNTVDNIQDGKYHVDINVNGTRISRQLVDFVKEENGLVSPCLDANFWRMTQVNLALLNQNKLSSKCLSPEGFITDAKVKFDREKLLLDISIPQAYMVNNPRNYVDSALWDMGEKAAFMNYNSSLYQTVIKDGGDVKTFHSGFSTGINWGLWRLRNQSSYSYNDYNGQVNNKFNSIRTYAMRALPKINSELVLGNINSRGNTFSSVPFTGFQLQTDTRMLPDSQRGYAPVIRGLANSTASVTIKQRGISIYQTTVAAGPFVINDLYPTSYEGDLTVEVIEANGKILYFTVPFNAVPNSLREAHSQYVFSLGEVNLFNSGNLFLDLAYDYGLSNTVTLTTGGRIGEDYYAVNFGTVLSTEWGAFGLRTIHSTSRVPMDSGFNDWNNGWRFGVEYSRAFDFGTSISLAGYHYSTGSFRELSDVLGEREFNESSTNEHSDSFVSETFQQRSEFNFTLNQSISDYGILYVGGSKRQYRDGRDDDEQFQLGYSTNIGRFSVSLSYSRQYSSKVPSQNMFSNHIKNNLDLNTPRVEEDLISLNLSVPLGSTQNSSLNIGANRSSGGRNMYNMGMSGTLSDDWSWTYGVDASLMHDDGTSKSVGLNTQKRFNEAIVSGSYSFSENSRQMSAGINGAIVTHSDGFILSQNLSETFGIIEAKGAQGAQVMNSFGSVIGEDGYGVIPSLAPYRINNVRLDSDGMLEKSELIMSQLKVIPYAGSIVKLKFKTLEGNAVLLVTSKVDGVIPIGAEVIDADGSVLGMVGQAGLAYIRTSNISGKLKIVWGNKIEQSCIINYALKDNMLQSKLIRLPVSCQQNQ